MSAVALSTDGTTLALAEASGRVWLHGYVLWCFLASVIVFPYRDIYQSGALHVAQVFGVPTIASAVGATLPSP